MEIFDVFISYRRSDGTELAKKINEYLTEKGLVVFFDTEKIESGDSFPQRINNALQQAPNYLLVATPKVFQFKDGEDWVRHEMAAACENFAHNHDSNRMFTIVVPSGITLPAKEYWPENTQMLSTIEVTKLKGALPNEQDFLAILTSVTKIRRHNMWNAGYRWLEESRKDGRRFAKLDIVKNILPLAEDRPNAKLPQYVQRQEIPGEGGKGNKQPLKDMLKGTAGHIYLIGPGGIGKTTALMNIMEDHYGKKNSPKPYDETKQIPLFVELSGAPDHLPPNMPKDTAPRDQLYYEGTSTFIRRSLYRQIRRYRTLKEVTDREVDLLDEAFFLDYTTVVKPVDDLLTEKKPAPEYLLLLDGLNEVSRMEIRVPFGNDPNDTKKYSVFKLVQNEIDFLMKMCPNVKIILTGRTDEQAVQNGRLTRMLLSGIADDEIKEYLRGADFTEEEIRAVAENSVLFETIRTPLFLTMYARLKKRKGICTQGEIFHTFFNERERNVIDCSDIDSGYTEQSRYIGIEEEARRAEQLPKIDADMQAFIIDFLLPAIARTIEKKNVFRIDSWNIFSLVTKVLKDNSPESVCGRWGQNVFTKYRKSPKEHVGSTAKRILELFGADEAERTQSILEIASRNLGILSTDEHGYAAFVHQHIRDYFAAVEVINSLKIGVTAFENGYSETALACVDGELKDDVLGFTVRRFIGEALGEHHNRPECDENGNWHYNVPDARPSDDNTSLCDRNLLTRALNIYRNRFDGADGYGLWNLVQILKEIRVDLSGEDFSKLDLTRVRLNGYCLGKMGCSAVFFKSKLGKELCYPEVNWTSRHAVPSYSPNGMNMIISCSIFRTVQIWDLHTFMPVKTITKCHDNVLTSARYSPNGKEFITTSGDGTAKIWDAENYSVLCKLKGHSDCVTGAAYSPDGQWIVTGSYDRTAIVWKRNNTNDFKILSGHTDNIKCVAFSTDGKYIATGSSDKTIKIWSAQSYKEINTLIGHDDCVTKIEFSPKGNIILSTSDDGTLRIWDFLTKGQSTVLNFHTNRLGKMATALFIDEGNSILALYNCGGVIWDSAKHNIRGVVRCIEDFFWCADLNPDGDKVAIGTSNNIEIREVSTLKRIMALGRDVETGLIDSASFAANDRYMILSQKYDIDKIKRSIWDVATQRFLDTSCVSNILQSKYDLLSRRMIPLQKMYGVWLEKTNFSHDNRYVAIFDFYTPDVSIFDTQNGNLKRVADFLNYKLCWHELNIFSPDNKRIVLIPIVKKYKVGKKYGAIVWKLDAPKKIAILRGHCMPVLSASFSSDGKKIVTASDDEAPIIWNADTYKKIGSLKGHSGSVNTAAFSPDGKRVVSASEDRTIKIWDTEKCICLRTLKGHTEGVRTAIYSSDQRYILSSSWKTVKIWDATTFECLHTIYNIPGLKVIGCDFRDLHPGSTLTDEDKQLLWEYGAKFNDKDMPPIPDAKC